MTIHQSINQLVKRPPAENRLDPVTAPGAIGAKTGLERKQAGAVKISDLSDEITVESSDGLFTFIVRVVTG